MPAYLFEIAPFLAGRSVTVRDVSGSDVASGTLDANAKFTASLPVGDYVASASDGRYTYRASGVVDQGDPDRLADSALSSTYAPAAGQGPLSAIKAMMDKGRTCVWQVLGDSTGNANDEWVYLTAQAIADRYPNHRVRSRVWNITTEKWDAPTTVQAGVGGDRYVEFDGTTNACLLATDSPLNSITGDLDVRAKVAADNWTGAGPFTIVSKFGNAPQRSWQFWLAGGWLNYRWTADGSTIVGSPSVNAGGLGQLPANGTPMWVRVVHDVDNGAGGTDVKFYKSTDDGATWTQIGATQTIAGVTSIADTTQALNVGARSDGASERWDGKVYEVEVHNGIDGPLVAPTQVDLWTVWPSTFNGTFGGAPILDVWNGSGSGYKMDDLINATRMPKMTQAVGQSLTVVSCSHNDFGETEAGYWAKWDTLANHIRSRSPQSAMAFTQQNPRTSPASFITQHETRLAMLVGYAQKQGAKVINVYDAFRNAGQPLSNLVNTSDGIHPTNAGSQVWSTEVMRGFV